MGFIVKKQIETNIGQVSDTFYVRIENCVLNKVNSNLFVMLAHYDSSTSASDFIGKYIEDNKSNTGPLSVNMKIIDGDPSAGYNKLMPPDSSCEFISFPMYYYYNLTKKEIVPTVIYSTKDVSTLVNYIDYDPSGNEIEVTKMENIQVDVSTLENIEKTARLVGDVSVNVYQLGYDKLKETYGQLFGESNIINI